MHNLTHEEIGSHQNLAAHIFLESFTIVKAYLRLHNAGDWNPGSCAKNFGKPEFLLFSNIAIVLRKHGVDLEIVVLIAVLVDSQGKLAVEHALGHQWIFKEVIVIEEQFLLQVVVSEVICRQETIYLSFRFAVWVHVWVAHTDFKGKRMPVGCVCILTFNSE